MSDNIFGERFYSLRRPAWHGLGRVSEEELGAVDAYGLSTPFTVSLEPLYSTVGGSLIELPLRGIFRHPVPDDPEYRLLGNVGTEYKLVDPLRVCELYDEHVQRPVETLGALGKGETLFLSTRLNSYAVKGDEIESYMLVDSPYSGNASISVRVTPVRVVCQNTLVAARSSATESYRIRHDEWAEKALGAWMQGLVARSEGKVKTLQEAFEQMSGRKIANDVEFNSLLWAIFPEPKPAVTDHPNEEYVARQQETYAANRRYIDTARDTVRQLFEGAGVGQNTEAAAGTAFGLFNAVAERAQYASGIRGASGLWDAISGYRAQESERAFTALWDFSRMPALEDAVPVAPVKKGRR